MLKWLLYVPFSLLAMVLCYLTNWIVVFFADEDGELPSFLHLWQTWDNSCYASDSVQHAPKFLQYDWARHYTEHLDADEYLRSVNRKRWYCTCIDHNFTLWERVQRYLCGVLWLTRNCSYGFAFYLLGADVSPMLKTEKSANTIFVREIFGGNVGGAWMYKNTAPIFSLFGWTVRWNNLLGWKIDDSAKVTTRAMIANRIAFSFEKGGQINES